MQPGPLCDQRLVANLYLHALGLLSFPDEKKAAVIVRGEFLGERSAGVIKLLTGGEATKHAAGFAKPHEADEYGRQQRSIGIVELHRP